VAVGVVVVGVRMPAPAFDAPSAAGASRDYLYTSM
jgi:hypothetical protein